ncbi:MAG: hypothetical protein LRS49_00645 [Desulfurococcales archaeon]|nr:hypothetical protein [Desulfurococcales archaeon]
MGPRRVQVLAEGCLDLQVAKLLVGSVGVEARFETIRGWRATVQQAASRAASFGLPTLAFIDSDVGASSRIREIEELLQKSGSIRGGLDPVRSESEGAHAVGARARLDSGGEVLVVLWVDPYDPEGRGGTVESLLEAMIGDAYGCRVRCTDPRGAPGCGACPSGALRAARVAEKLSVLVALASCYGGGTLVAVADEGSGRCGLPVYSIMSKLGKLRETGPYKAYSKLLSELLSRG